MICLKKKISDVNIYTFALFCYPSLNPGIGRGLWPFLPLYCYASGLSVPVPFILKNKTA